MSLVPSPVSKARFIYGQNIYASEGDPVEVRRRIGMYSQKPKSFPEEYLRKRWPGGRGSTVFKGGWDVLNMDEWVEHCLRKAALWDEVKDKLHQSGLSLSGGQQQRCVSPRAIAVKPEIILMMSRPLHFIRIATL